MIRILLVVVTALLLSGCTNGRPVKEPFPDADCVDGMADGYTQTKLKFGDSRIAMLPVSEVLPNTKFRIRVIAPEGFKNKNVEVTSKTADSSWLDTDPMLPQPRTDVIFVDGCVPADADEGEIYSFDVKITGVGTLDPRLEVVRK